MRQRGDGDYETVLVEEGDRTLNARDPYPRTAGPWPVGGTGRVATSFRSRYNPFVLHHHFPPRNPVYGRNIVAFTPPVSVSTLSITVSIVALWLRLIYPSLWYSVLCHPPLRCMLLPNCMHSTADGLGSSYTVTHLSLCSTSEDDPYWQNQLEL